MPCRPFPKGRTWRSLRRRRSRGSMWIDRGSRSSSGPGLWQGRCAQHSHRVTHQTGDCRTCAVLNCECGTETWRSRASGTASPRPPDAWQDTEPAVHTLRTPSPNCFGTFVTEVSLYRHQDYVFSKRAAFFSGLKSKVGHIMAKASYKLLKLYQLQTVKTVGSAGCAIRPRGALFFRTAYCEGRAGRTSRSSGAPVALEPTPPVSEAHRNLVWQGLHPWRLAPARPEGAPRW